MEHFYQNIQGWSTEFDQGQLLDTILKIVGNKELKIAEIGTYMGRCTAMWNVKLINRGINYDYYTIDHFLGSSEHHAKSMPNYKTTLKNLEPIQNKIILLNLPSVEASTKFKDEYFDIVYIDASHEYEFVKEDIIAWLPKVKKGGIICGDDYVIGWPGVIKAVDEFFSKVNIIGNQQWYYINV